LVHTASNAKVARALSTDAEEDKAPAAAEDAPPSKQLNVSFSNTAPIDKAPMNKRESKESQSGSLNPSRAFDVSVTAEIGIESPREASVLDEAVVA